MRRSRSRLKRNEVDGEGEIQRERERERERETARGKSFSFERGARHKADNDERTPRRIVRGVENCLIVSSLLGRRGLVIFLSIGQSAAPPARKAPRNPNAR